MGFPEKCRRLARKFTSTISPQRGYRNGNLHLGENRTIEPLLSGVRRWTALEELREDMAILLARRV